MVQVLAVVVKISVFMNRIIKGGNKMKCADCNLWYIDINSIWPCCHADPNWPAPCEYDDDESEEEEYKWINEWGNATLINVPWIETDWDDP